MLFQKKAVLLQSLLFRSAYILPNCVMVAPQILVLFVWVRVLVRQQKKRLTPLFLLLYETLTLGSYLASLERLLLISLRSNDYCLEQFTSPGSATFSKKRPQWSLLLVIDKLLVVMYWLIKITEYIQSIYRVRWDTMRIGNG